MERAALVYRDFARETVRRTVLEWHEFRRDEVMGMAENAGIPEDERSPVVDYIAQELNGLHEGNAIRYRLTPADLAAMREQNT